MICTERGERKRKRERVKKKEKVGPFCLREFSKQKRRRVWIVGPILLFSANPENLVILSLKLEKREKKPSFFVITSYYYSLSPISLVSLALLYTYWVG